MNSEHDRTDGLAAVEPDPISPTVNTKRSQARPAAQSTPWLLWLLVILLGGALGAFYWQQTRFSLSQSASLQVLQESNQQITAALNTAQTDMRSELQAQVALMQDSSGALQQAMSELQAMEQQDEQRLQGLQQRLERQLQDTQVVVTALQRQVAGLHQRDMRWINAEAAYLMRLADHKLTLEFNPQAALQLLRSVLVLLRDQLDPLAQTALQSLQQDIAALESLQFPDRLALAQRVTELAAVLETVSVTGTRQASYEQGLRVTRDQIAAVETEQSWTAVVVDLLRSIFVWRQNEHNPLEFLASDQEDLIKLQMRLLLDQARFAVIQADQLLFEDSLQQVASVLQRYFMQESEVAIQLHDDVQALSVQSVQIDLPDLSATRSLIEQLQGAAPDVSPASPESAPPLEPYAEPGPELTPGADPGTMVEEIVE
ncbi:MAG: uroporphyrinogen-III C-methyltransferase [Pseudohongiella sp.]|nr:uroporphyrinogen-III C-methyltransferase [Pseudohongiella sp.]